MGAVQAAVHNPRFIFSTITMGPKRRMFKPSVFNAKLSLPYSECFVDAATPDYFAIQTKNAFHKCKEHGLHLPPWGTRKAGIRSPSGVPGLGNQPIRARTLHAQSR